MPKDIYYYITDHHNDHMSKWLESGTNEDTVHPLTHDYWTLKPLDDFEDKSSANSKSVAEDKTKIKANLSEQTKTDDEKVSDENDDMNIEDGKDNDPNDVQISSEVDDIVGSQEKNRRSWRRRWHRLKRGNDRKEKHNKPV